MKDWRLTTQENYLKGVAITWKKFKASPPNNNQRYGSDHDHCEFCGHTFMEEIIEDDCSTAGYCTLEGKHWICETCYNDFKDHFNWKVI